MRAGLVARLPSGFAHWAFHHHNRRVTSFFGRTLHPPGCRYVENTLMQTADTIAGTRFGWLRLLVLTGLLLCLLAPAAAGAQGLKDDDAQW